jgi:hypothetical protein
MNRRPAFSEALNKLTKNKKKPNKNFEKARKFLEKNLKLKAPIEAPSTNRTVSLVPVSLPPVPIIPNIIIKETVDNYSDSDPDLIKPFETSSPVPKITSFSFKSPWQNSEIKKINISSEFSKTPRQNTNYLQSFGVIPKPPPLPKFETFKPKSFLSEEVKNQQAIKKGIEEKIKIQEEIQRNLEKELLEETIAIENSIATKKLEEEKSKEKFQKSLLQFLRNKYESEEESENYYSTEETAVKMNYLKLRNTIPEFNGTNRELEKFLNSCDYVYRFVDKNPLAQNDFIHFISTKLDSTTFNFFKRNNFSNYVALKEALIKKFRSKKTRYQLNSEILQLKKHPFESMEHYLLKLEDLGKDLEMILNEEWTNFPSIVEKEVNDTLLDSLRINSTNRFKSIFDNRKFVNFKEARDLMMEISDREDLDKKKPDNLIIIITKMI